MGPSPVPFFLYSHLAMYPTHAIACFRQCITFVSRLSCTKIYCMCTFIIALAVYAWMPAASTHMHSCRSLSPIQDTAYIKCTISSKPWNATKVIPDKYVSEIVQLQGTDGKTTLWLQLNKPATGKTDVLMATDLNNWTDEHFNMYMIQTGKTVITKMNDTWIEGNFSFTARDNRSLKQIEVTDGTFRVPNPASFKKK